MKKLQYFFTFLILIFGVCLLFSCSNKGDRPKVKLFSLDVDFSSITFDIKVTEPEDVIIKEIYVSLYQETEVVETLTSKDGIQKVGVTESIGFYMLNPNTQYEIAISFDYSKGVHQTGNATIESFILTTKKNDTGIIAEISNFFLSTKEVSFDAVLDDPNDLVEVVNIYLYEGESLLYSLSTLENLQLDKNMQCLFSLLPPNSSFTIFLCVTFTSNQGKEYKDLVIAKKDFMTSNYSLEPNAYFLDVYFNYDEVRFKVNFNNSYQLLLDAVIQLVDSRETIIYEYVINDFLNFNKSKEYKVEKLKSNKTYKLRVIGRYKTPYGIMENKNIGEKEITTPSFNMNPSVKLEKVLVNQDEVKFNYTITDTYDMLTNLSIQLLDKDNKVIDEIIDQEELIKGIHQGSFKGLEPNNTYKIAIVGSYTYEGLVEAEKIFAEKEIQTEDFDFYPSVTITEVQVNQTGITLSYTILDSYDMLTSLYCQLYNWDMTLIKEIDLKNLKSKGSHRILIDVKDITNFKIELFGGYTHLNNENSLHFDTYEYFIQADENFQYDVTNEGILIRKYIGESEVCVIPEVIDGIEVKRIFKSAFMNSNIRSVIIPNSVTSIEYQAFQGCQQLSYVTIPNGVIKIESSAFWDCKNLKSIYLPASLTFVGTNVFANCVNLHSIYYGGSIEEWCELNCGVFSSSSNNHFYCKGETQKWEEVTSITIPNTLTKISRDQFNGFDHVKSFVIPNTITSIESSAFSYCEGITSLEIPDSVTSIGTFAFYSCSNLENITLPKNLNSIENYTFSDCANLKSILIPRNTTKIGEGAFENCNKLEFIVIPYQVATIGSRAFYINNAKLTINCEVASKPIGWNDDWISSTSLVYWGGDNGKGLQTILSHRRIGMTI